MFVFFYTHTINTWRNPHTVKKNQYTEAVCRDLEKSSLHARHIYFDI